MQELGIVRTVTLQIYLMITPQFKYIFQSHLPKTFEIRFIKYTALLGVHCHYVMKYLIAAQDFDGGKELIRM